MTSKSPKPVPNLTDFLDGPVITAIIYTVTNTVTVVTIITTVRQGLTLIFFSQIAVQFLIPTFKQN